MKLNMFGITGHGTEVSVIFHLGHEFKFCLEIFAH